MVLYVYSIKSSHSSLNKIKYIEKELKKIYDSFTTISFDEIDTISLNDVKTLIFSGGDGVFNQIINKCAQHLHIVFGYIPLGTANDIGHNFDIKNLKSSLEIIKNGVIKEYQLSQIENRLFIYALSCGPLSVVSTKSQRTTKKVFSKLTYKIRGIWYMFYPKKYVYINVGDFVIEDKFLVVLVLKTKFLGGVKIKKDNDLSKFDVVLVKNIIDLVKVFIFKKYSVIKAEEIYLQSESNWCVDGENLPVKNGNIKLSNKKIKMLSKNA